jgi:hypothetical protein
MGKTITAGNLFAEVAPVRPLAGRHESLCYTYGGNMAQRLTRHEIPCALPAFVEIEGGQYISHREATIAQWRYHGSKGNDQHIVDQLLQLAAKVGVPDDVPLMPRLRSVSGDNVFVLHVKSRG